MQLLKREGLFLYWLLPAADGGILNRFLRKRFFRLRYRVFALRRKTEPENAKKLESDAYDKHSDFIVCIRLLKIVAGCRIIPEKMPVEKGLAPLESVLPKSFEVSRMISEDAKIKCILYILIYRYALERGYEQMYAFARKGFMKVFRREGISVFKQVGPEFRHRNLTLVPLSARVGEIPLLVESKMLNLL